MRAHVLAISVAVIALLSAGVLLLWRERLNTADVGGSAGISKALAANQETLARLEEKITNMQGRLDSLHAPTSSEVQPAAPSASGRGPVGLRSPEEAEALVARQTEATEEKSRNEPIDDAWAPGYERQLQQAIEKLPSVKKVIELSCRTSVCRVEVTHATVNDQHAFHQEFLGSAPDSTAIHLTPRQNGEGSLSTVCQIIRRGYPIPGSDEPLPTR